MNVLTTRRYGMGALQKLEALASNTAHLPKSSE
jgi:hypothetical protein